MGVVHDAGGHRLLHGAGGLSGRGVFGAKNAVLCAVSFEATVTVSNGVFGMLWENFGDVG